MEKKLQTKSQGKRAEDLACELLRTKGYRIIDRNFHSKFGEIDIIAVHDSTLVFVEVKARWSNKFGAPEEAVTKGKLWKIQRTGEYYSLLHPELPKKLRIEVVAMEFRAGEAVSSKLIQAY